MNEPTAVFLSAFAWPAAVVGILVAYRGPVARLVNALVRRVERGDEVTIATWITLGKAVGPLKVPATDGLVTDDHLALIHRSWRVPHRDSEFGGQAMYQVQVILFGQNSALDRVEYVLYRLDPAYPTPIRTGGVREANFELKELANGYSLVRAEVKIKGQAALVYLSRFIDLTEESPRLKGTYVQ